MSELVNRVALPQAHLSVNGFDTGHRDVFSTKAGIALPVVALETVPDGHYEIDAGNILRTSEMQTASFVRMKQNLDFYYVPYSQLYGRFDDVLFDKKDPHRTRLIDVTYKDDVVPYFPYYFTVLALYEQYIYARLGEQLEQQGGSSSALFSLPYGDGTKYLAIMFPNEHTLCSDERGEYLAEDFLRVMDMMGFGNWLPIFKNLFNEFIIRNGSDSASEAPDYYVQKLVGTSYDMSTAKVGSFGISQIESIQSLNDYSLVAYIMSDSTDYNTLVRDLSILPFAAYQKIWCDFYRNSTYDNTPFLFDSFQFPEYPFIYNFDGYEIAGKGWQTYFTFANFFMAFLRPRERQWKKDLFTGLFPDAQSGDAAIANIASDSVVFGSNSAVDNSDFPFVSQDQNGNIYGEYEGERSNFLAQTSAVGISALSIRYANALQAYREMIVRAGNKHKDLQLAEYGKVSKYTLDDYAVYIGSYDATIDVNTVTATAETQDINLGQLGANGISTLGGKKINFHSNEFGIIIGIYSILPQAEYEAFGINKLHTRLKQFDFYHPKFANLGFSPVFQFEFNASRLPMATESFFDRTLGFTARDHEYKCAFDKVHGEFFGSFAGIGDMEQPMLGTFSDYCAARRSDDIESDTLDKLYVDGHCLDRIFYAAQNWHQSSDHFKVNMYFDIKSVLPMPVSGLPINQ